MKTAIEDLIKELEQFSNFPMVDKATVTACIEFTKLRRQKEREQIESAFNDGYYYNKPFTKKEYYETTFKK